jgi:hypothetical protein
VGPNGPLLNLNPGLLRDAVSTSYIKYQEEVKARHSLLCPMGVALGLIDRRRSFTLTERLDDREVNLELDR